MNMLWFYSKSIYYGMLIFLDTIFTNWNQISIIGTFILPSKTRVIRSDLIIAYRVRFVKCLTQRWNKLLMNVVIPALYLFLS